MTTNPFDSSDDEKEATPPPPPQNKTTVEDAKSSEKTAAAAEGKKLSPKTSPKAASSPVQSKAAITNPFSSSGDEHEDDKKKLKKEASKKKKKKKSKKKESASKEKHLSLSPKDKKKKTASLPSSPKVAAPSANPFSDNDDDDDDDDDDEKRTPPAAAAAHDTAELDTALENMDIDGDFNVFESSTSIPDEEMPSERIEFWQERLQRDEVYSHRYKPSAEEKKELSDLQNQLAGGEGTSLWNSLFGSGNAADTAKLDASSQQAVQELLVGGGDASLLTNMADMVPSKPVSIILKRGTVQWNESKTAEVVLLTHGLLIIQLEYQTGLMGRKTIQQSLAQATLWDAVAFAGPLPSKPQTAWRLVRKNDATSICEFTCATPVQQSAWLRALERIVIQHHLHKKTAPQDLGWQYKVVHKPAFTLAVKGMDDGLPLPQDLNIVDEYNEYAPLHYAVRLNQCTAARRQLEAGADVNAKDGEGHTAMYYALRDEVSEEMVNLLEKHGATGKKKNKEWKAAEELFGRVKAAEEKVAHKKREQEQLEKAKAAQSQMGENMRLMNERGQKIEEMDGKARHLNEEAKNYADMAKQLKEKTKRGAKGSKWLPF